MDNRVETLVSAIGKLRDYSNNQQDLVDVKMALNKFFKPDAECIKFYYTLNVDKIPFGCVVMPSFTNNEIQNFIIVGETPSAINKYEVELDSKVFDYGLNDEEVASIILYDVYHMIKDLNPLNRVRGAIDLYLSDYEKTLIIRNSVQYQAILALGLYDALIQFTSCLNLPSDVESDPFLEDIGLDCFKDACDKLYRQIPGCENEASRMPNLSMLNWCLRLYEDVEKERIPAIHVMQRAKELTASQLYISKMNAVITAMNRIDTDLIITEAVQSVFMESKKRSGFLANLKYSGLRDIESDLYEFQIRAKNAETEQEVMYALKQINARLAILEDYIRENQDDPDLDRWINVKMEYMEIRDQLAKKKLNRRQYGIFVDYSKLDDLDNEEE